jgi:hypothetical protein
MVVSDENAESVSVWQWNVAKVGELLVSRITDKVPLADSTLPITAFTRT